jgi:hypothetical protein
MLKTRLLRLYLSRETVPFTFPFPHSHSQLSFLVLASWRCFDFDIFGIFGAEGQLKLKLEGEAAFEGLVSYVYSV